MPDELNDHPWDHEWIIGDQIGAGGQGETYHATSRSNPELRAVIKKLKHNDSLQARGRMNSEVANLELLRAEGGAVPQVYDHNTHAHKDQAIDLYMVMEYVEGETLDKIIETHGTLSFEDATRIALKLCETITLAHNNLILHRDLKPENIIVRNLKSADVMIIDYGLSFNVENPTNLTRASEHLWNAFFTLPATTVPGGNRKDPRVDVASVCAIFYYLLTGKIPSSLTDDNGLPPHQRPGCSPKEFIKNESLISQFEVLFNQGFATDVDFRFQTIEEFKDRIEGLQNDGQISPIEDPISVSKRLSLMLLKKDRKSQLLEFHPKAEKINSEIEKYAIKFVGKLNRFMISLDNVSIHPNGYRAPEEFDHVISQNFQIKMNPAHHNQLRILMFAFVAKGNQCAILSKRFERNDNQKILASTEWKELVWYDSETDPSIENIKKEIQMWLNDSMEQLLFLFD